MSQTMPLAVQSAWVRPADYNTPRTNPTPADPAACAYTLPDWNPKAWANKATNHPAGAPDFTFVTLISVSSNMPY